MKRLEYLAGFLDGDGCITLGCPRTTSSGGRGYSVFVNAVNTDIRPLEMFRDVFGGSLSPMGRGNEKHSPSFQWSVAAEKAIPVVVALMPFLILKRRDAEIALEFQALLRGSKRGPRGSHADSFAARDVLKGEMVARHAPNSGVITQHQGGVSLEYLAGHFDAEGCVVIPLVRTRASLGFSARHSLRVSVTGTDPGAVNVFRDTFGGSVQVAKRGNPKHSPRFDWVIVSESAKKPLEAMAELLIVKRRDAEIGLALQRLMSQGKRGHRVPAPVFAQRETLRLQLVKRHGLASTAVL